MSFSEWREVLLGDYINIKHGYAFKGEFFSETETEDVLVTPGNFKIGGGFKEDKLKFYNGDYPGEYVLKPNDVIVTMTDLSKMGDTLGYSALVPYNEKRRYLHNQRIGLVEFLSQEVLPSFIYWRLRSNDYQKFIVGSASGTTVKHTSPKTIKKYRFYLPPLPEQKAIADTLSCLDDKIELNNRSNKTLEEMAQAIFESCFVDFEPFQDGEFEDSELGRIPKGWRVGTIDEFAKDMKNGGTPSRKKDNFWNSNDIPWIKTGEIKNSLIIKSEEHISCERLNNSSAKVLPYNSVLMAMYGATAGQVALLKFEASTNQACCAMICNSANKAIFLYLYLLANQSHIESLAVGAAQQNLSKDTISKLKLTIPKDEMIESVIFDEIFICIENNLRENQTLTAIRDTLLPKLMSGEIRVPLQEVQ